MPFARCLPSLLVALLALAGGAPASAQDEGEPQAPIDFEQIRADRKAQQIRDSPMNPRVSRYISAAAEALDEDDAQEAIRLLERILESRLNDTETAHVLRMLGHVHYAAEEHEKAIGYFEKTLQQEAFSLEDENRFRFNIAQLHMGLEQWEQAIRWFEEWIRYSQDPAPQGYYLMAISHFQLEDFEAAIANAVKAVEAAAVPDEAWLRILAALYSQQQDYAKATPVLEELLLRYPDKQYWVQLSLIHAARDDYDTSLAVQQVAYRQGFLTEDEQLRRLARSYLYNDLPYPAAQVLEKGLGEGTIEPDPEAYELLANSWIAAREYDRSLPPLKKAAELAEHGNLDVRLGQVFMQRERWNEAIEWLERGLGKGDLDKRGAAQLLLGIAYYNAERPSQARSHFVQAREHEETRAQADRWITHIANETASQAG